MTLVHDPDQRDHERHHGQLDDHDDDPDRGGTGHPPGARIVEPAGRVARDERAEFADGTGDAGWPHPATSEQQRSKAERYERAERQQEDRGTRDDHREIARPQRRGRARSRHHRDRATTAASSRSAPARQRPSLNGLELCGIRTVSTLSPASCASAAAASAGHRRPPPTTATTDRRAMSEAPTARKYVSASAMPHRPARVAEETHTTVEAGSRIRSAAGAPPASATVSTNVSRASDAMRRIAVSVPGGSAGTPRAGDGPASNGTPSIVVINLGRTDGAIGQDIAAMSDGQYSAGWSAPALRAPHIGTASTMTGSSPRRCANAPASSRVIVVRPAPPSQPTTGTVAPRRTGWRASSSRARRLSSSCGVSSRGTVGRRSSSPSS